MKTLIITLFLSITFGNNLALILHFLECLLHLLFGDATVIVFIEEIKQDCGSKIVPTTRVYVQHV